MRTKSQEGLRFTLALVAVGLVFLQGASAAEGPPREFEVFLDVGNAALGAYTLTLTFPSDRVQVESVTGGDTSPFTSPPFVNPQSFSSGKTRLSAFQAQSMSSPTGAVSVAKVTVVPTNTEDSTPGRNRFSSHHLSRIPFQVRVETVVNPEGRTLTPRVTVRPLAMAGGQDTQENRGEVRGSRN